MALDTRNKRAAAINPSSPWRGMLPAPDGVVDSDDRATVAFLYADRIKEAAGFTATSWDQIVSGANIAFSNNALTGTKTSGAASFYETAISTHALSSGKAVFAVTFDNIVTANDIVAVGLSNSPVPSSNWPGVNANSIGFYDGIGRVYYNGVSVATIATFVEGDTVTVAVDRDASLVWFRVNSGNWNNNGSANPATGTGGIDISGITGPLYAVSALYNVNDAITANFAPNVSLAGFSNWPSSGGFGTAISVGASTAAASGTATGSGSASGSASATAEASGIAAGTGSASAVSTSIVSSSASASGAGSASATGASTAASTASASGVGSASAAGVNIIASEASASGTGSASAAGASTAASTASASGTGSASATGASFAASTASASGTGSASAASTSVADSAGSASGVGSASAVGATFTLFYLRPDADVALDGWTDELDGTTNIFNSINEASVDDNDYVKSPTRTGATADLKVRLYEGAALIAEWTHSGISESFVTATQTLTTEQFDSITDFSDLFIELDDNNGAIYRFSLGNPTTGVSPTAKLRYRYKKMAA